MSLIVRRLTVLLLFIFFVAPSWAQRTSPAATILSVPERVDLCDAELFLDPDGVPTALVGGRLLFTISDSFLDEKDPPFAAMNDEETAEAIICSPHGDIIMKQGNTICRFAGGEGSGIERIMEMPDTNFDIYPTQSVSIYVTMPRGGGTEVYLLNTENLESVKLFVSEVPLKGIVGDGAITFGFTENEVFLFGKESVRLFSCDTPVTSIAVCTPGIFFASTDGVYYISGDNEATRVYNTGARKLLGIDDFLYILDDAGTFFKINSVTDILKKANES